MKISIIIPSYNRAKWLPALFERLEPFSELFAEVVVVDDGSTDGTSELLRHFPSIRYIYQANQGPSAARNLGLQHATGDLVHFLDSDDLPDSDFYSSVLPAFTDANIHLAIVNYRMVTGGGDLITDNSFEKQGFNDLLKSELFSLPGTALQALLLRHSVVPTSGVVFRRAFLTNAWNPRIRVGEDRLFLLQNIASSPADVRVYSKPLWTFQVHESNSFNANPRKDCLAYRDNLSLKAITQSLPDLNPSDIRHLARSQAMNYFDWAWFCRKQRRHGRAEILLKAAFQIAPSWRILRARIINRLRVG